MGRSICATCQVGSVEIMAEKKRAMSQENLTLRDCKQPAQLKETSYGLEISDIPSRGTCILLSRQ